MKQNPCEREGGGGRCVLTQPCAPPPVFLVPMLFAPPPPPPPPTVAGEFCEYVATDHCDNPVIIDPDTAADLFNSDDQLTDPQYEQWCLFPC